MLNIIKAYQSKINKFAIYLGTFILSLLVIFFCYIGYFQRPIADDFCTISVVNTNGYWGTLLKYFGIRYSSSIFSYFVVLFTPKIFQFLVPIFLLIMTIFIYVVLKRLMINNKNLIVSTLFLTELLFTSLLLITPNPAESIYWFGASVVYMWPLLFIFIDILLCLYLHKIRNTWFKNGYYMLIFLCSYFAFGFSESLAFAFLPIVVGLVMLSLIKDRKKLLLTLVVLFANFASVMTMYLLPARVQRIQMYKSAGIIFKPTISEVALGSIHGMFNFVKSIIFTPQYLIMILVLFAGCFLLFYKFIKSQLSLKYEGLGNKVVILLFFSVLPFSLWFCLVPGYYIFPEGPPNRSFLTLVYILIAYILMLAYVLADYIKQLSQNKLKLWGYLKNITLIFGLTIVLITMIFIGKYHYGYIFKSIFDKIETTIQYNVEFAKNYDKREKYIIEQRGLGNLNILIRPIVNNFTPERNMSTDPTHWINRCASNYYGVRSLRLISE